MRATKRKWQNVALAVDQDSVCGGNKASPQRSTQLLPSTCILPCGIRPVPVSFIHALLDVLLEGGHLMGRKKGSQVSHKSGRPAIPQQTRQNLWIAAGGRCEYPGCNRVLGFDDVEQIEINYAHIAHIVGAVPGGPRGNPTLSRKLATSISNLMLLCPEHNHLIDSDDSKYSIEFLHKRKRQRESAIKNLFDRIGAERTTVIKFRTQINGKSTAIADADILLAVLPNTASVADVADMDYTGIQDNLPSALQVVSEQIAPKVHSELNMREHSGTLYPISVFAIGRIPCLMTLGKELCATGAPTIYQFHRDTKSWCWLDEEPDREILPGEGISLVGPPTSDGRAIPVVAVGITDRVNQDEITATLGPNVSIYNIVASSPDFNFMKYRSQLAKFADVWNKTMREIHSTWPQISHVAVFPAVPVSVAVQMGMSHVQASPVLRVYDKQGNNWIQTIDI